MARWMAQLRPVSEAWEWQLDGRCRDRSGAQFFHPDDDLGRISRRLREAAAKRLCEDCPVRRQCATHALTVGEEYGVWGGFSESERTTLRDIGWQDTLDRRRLADIGRLETRLARVAAQKEQAKEQRLREAMNGGKSATAPRSDRQPTHPAAGQHGTAANNDGAPTRTDRRVGAGRP